MIDAVLGIGDDGSVEFVIAGTSDMFHEGDTFDMDIDDVKRRVRVVSAEFDEQRVVLPNFNIFPGSWTVSVVADDGSR